MLAIMLFGYSLGLLLKHFTEPVPPPTHLSLDHLVPGPVLHRARLGQDLGQLPIPKVPKSKTSLRLVRKTRKMPSGLRLRL